MDVSSVGRAAVFLFVRKDTQLAVYPVNGGHENILLVDGLDVSPFPLIRPVFL